MIDYTEEQILNAIENSRGIISTVADRLGCAWHTAESYINKFESTKKALNNENERMLDFAENKLYKSIEEQSEPMIKWYLSTKGKKRGFTESKNIDLTTGGDKLPTKIIIQSVKPEDKE